MDDVYKKAFDNKVQEIVKISKEILAIAEEENSLDIIEIDHDGITIRIDKNTVLEDDDVFGIISHAESLKDEVVIIKSKQRNICIKRDGMSAEEFEEYWDFNIVGSKGRKSYSVVDDTLSGDEIKDILDADEYGEIINPPYREDS